MVFSPLVIKLSLKSYMYIYIYSLTLFTSSTLFSLSQFSRCKMLADTFHVLISHVISGSIPRRRLLNIYSSIIRSSRELALLPLSPVRPASLPSTLRRRTYWLNTSRMRMPIVFSLSLIVIGEYSFVCVDYAFCMCDVQDM